MTKPAAKKTKKETDEEAFIPLETADESSRVATSVFKVQFEKQVKELTDRLTRQEDRNTNIIIGVIVVTFLFVAGIAYNDHLFMASYNQNSLDAKKEISDKVHDLETENAMLKQEITSKMDRLSDKQDYLERTVLDKATTK